jgi:hypothetical protein
MAYHLRIRVGTAERAQNQTIQFPAAFAHPTAGHDRIDQAAHPLSQKE